MNTNTFLNTYNPVYIKTTPTRTHTSVNIDTSVQLYFHLHICTITPIPTPFVYLRLYTRTPTPRCTFIYVLATPTYPQSPQSAGPVRFLIFCSVSIVLLASPVAGRKPQCTAGAVQQGMCSIRPIHKNIKSAPARPGRSRVGPALYVFSLLVHTYVQCTTSFISIRIHLHRPTVHLHRQYICTSTTTYTVHLYHLHHVTYPKMYCTVYTQEAKYVERWPSTTSAWAGWSRFYIPVDRYAGVHSLLRWPSRTLGSSTCH
jgi:hypothetical protein